MVGNKWQTLAVVGLGSFMSALDSSIVNIALPVIKETTRCSVTTVEWVSLSYLITTSASLLLFGRLADIYGQRRIYLLGQGIFVAASLGCGLSGHVGLLIAARAVQALGASMILALSPGILLSAFPGSERGRALGMQATMTYFGIAIGPVLGGFLIHLAGWPAIFFVNVPIGLVIMRVAHRALRVDSRPTGQPFDPVGVVLLGITLVTILFVLSKGGDLGWQHPLIIGLALGGVTAGIAFVVTEARLEHPALDLRLFHNRLFSGSVLAAYLNYMASSSITFLLPFFLMTGVGFSAKKAGTFLVTIPISMMILTGPSGWLSDRVGVRLPATAGMLFMALGALLLSRIQLGFPPAFLVMVLAFVGVGSGLFTAPNNSALMGAAPLERRGVAGAILATARTTGFATGIALAGTIYTHSLPHWEQTPEGVAHAVRNSLSVTVCVALAGAVCSVLRSRPGA